MAEIDLTAKLSLEPLLGRTLVLVAHPDDELLGCGALLQRMSVSIVVVATDGAPGDRHFWRPFGSQRSYRTLRRLEARQSLAFASVAHAEFFAIPDQELFCHLQVAWELLWACCERAAPQTILTHAYEGGHPDHDVCSFLGAVVGGHFGLPVWEMPLYHLVGGNIVRQQFPAWPAMHTGAMLALDAKEFENKSRMLRAYVSQADVLRDFDLRVERFRPQPAYDYTRPPHDGVLNYEQWRWPMTGSGLCAAFANFLRQNSTLLRARRASCA